MKVPFLTYSVDEIVVISDSVEVVDVVVTSVLGEKSQTRNKAKFKLFSYSVEETVVTSDSVDEVDVVVTSVLGR